MLTKTSKSGQGCLFSALQMKGMVTEAHINARYKELRPNSRESKFTPGTVALGWVYQALSSNGGSCVSATAALLALPDRNVSSDRTGGYSKARARMPTEMAHELASNQADHNTKAYQGRPPNGFTETYLIDGTIIKLADTAENQKAYPQHGMQQEGLGNPLIRAVFLTSGNHGSVLDAAFAAFQGKGTGELSLALPLIEKHLKPGQLLLGDRYFETAGLIGVVQGLNSDYIFPSHGARDVDFRTGERLGECDHLVVYDDAGAPVKVRQVKVSIHDDNGNPINIVLVTSLFDAEKYPPETLAKLYENRWNIELDIRSLKKSVSIDYINCNTPDMVYKHFWFAIYAYNLVCTLRIHAVKSTRQKPRQLGFVGAIAIIKAFFYDILVVGVKQITWNKIMNFLKVNKVGCRPGRFEPRGVKRRTGSKFDYLKVSRKAWKECHA